MATGRGSMIHRQLAIGVLDLMAVLTAFPLQYVLTLECHLDREEKTISEILQAYRALVRIATERISNRASIGQAAQNSMAMQLETQRLVGSSQSRCDSRPDELITFSFRRSKA